MYIGDLTKRCMIERKSVTQDATYGTEIITWVVVGVAWCNVQDAVPSRDERIMQGLSVASVRTRVRLRYRSDIDTTMRIIMLRPTEKIYQIIGGPAEIGARDGIEIMCEEVTSGE